MGYNPTKCMELGRWGEDLVARLYRGVVVEQNEEDHNRPPDVVTADAAIEVKTLRAGAVPRTYMAPSARRAKIYWARRRGLHGLTVLVLLGDTWAEVWEGPGFKSYQAGIGKCRLRARLSVWNPS